MAKRYATIKDIAQVLKISVATVSRALRDAHDVSKDTRIRVVETASKLNYRPNFNATGLVKRSTHKIGIIIPSITNYYFSTVITGIQEYAFGKGYQVILYVTNDSSDWEEKIVRELSPSNIDGILACITSNTSSFTHFQDLIDEGLPTVFFDRFSAALNASRVLQDDYNGACIAIEHLIQSGYRKIAHVTGPHNLSLTQNRLRGYYDTLQKYGLNTFGVIHSGFSKEDGFADLNRLLEFSNIPDAVFAVNDRKAIGVMLALKKLNIEIGKGVGVIGFTNDPISEIISPSLTTIAEPAYDIGKQCCELLIRHIQKNDYPVQEIILPTELVIRESTALNLDNNPQKHKRPSV